MKQTFLIMIMLVMFSTNIFATEIVSEKSEPKTRSENASDFFDGLARLMNVTDNKTNKEEKKNETESN